MANNYAWVTDVICIICVTSISSVIRAKMFPWRKAPAWWRWLNNGPGYADDMYRPIPSSRRNRDIVKTKRHVPLVQLRSSPIHAEPWQTNLQVSSTSLWQPSTASSESCFTQPPTGSAIWGHPTATSTPAHLLHWVSLKTVMFCY